MMKNIDWIIMVEINVDQMKDTGAQNLGVNLF